MFSRFVFLLFVSCFTVWGKVKYLPYEDDVLNELLAAANEIRSLGSAEKEKLSDDEYEEIDRKREFLYNKIGSLCESFGQGTLPLYIPQKPDLEKLPLSGWTEKELMAAGENGATTACMELTYRWLKMHTRDETRWTVYSQVNKWLSLAKERKHPGVEFLWNLLLTLPDRFVREKSGNPYRNIPGFDEFDRILNEGDIAAYKIIRQLHNLKMVSAEEWIRAAYRHLEKKAEQGDCAAQRRYVMWSCINDSYTWPPESVINLDDQNLTAGKRGMRDKWLTLLCEEGDIEAKYYRLIGYRPKTYTADDVEMILCDTVDLYCAGYVLIYGNEDLTRIFEDIFIHSSFLQATFPMLDQTLLHGSIGNALRARGDFGLIANPFRAAFSTFPSDEEMRVIAQNSADELIGMGSGHLYAPSLQDYDIFVESCVFLNFSCPETNFLLHTTVAPQAAKGQPGAMELMARCYMQGAEIKQDICKALDLWERALAFYEPLAGKSAFDFLENVLEIKTNIEWCKMKLAGKDENLKREIAQRLKILEKESEPYVCEKPEANKVGIRILNYLLGYMYETGYGTPVDCEKAVSCYQKSPCMIEALNNLGCMYEDGRGIECDLNKALNLFKKAATRRNSPARETARENLKRLEDKMK